MELVADPRDQEESWLGSLRRKHSALSSVLSMLTKDGKNKLIFTRHDFAAVFLIDALKKGRSSD